MGGGGGVSLLNRKPSIFTGSMITKTICINGERGEEVETGEGRGTRLLDQKAVGSKT